MNNILYNFKNGNTEITIFADGTKIREYDDSEISISEFPESIDVKLTNHCDLGCLVCHEQSTTKGVHGDLNKLLEVISCLPAGTEIANGGGDPLSHPDLIPYLTILKSRGIISNITINQGHLKQNFDLIEHIIKEKLVHGVGISITSKNYTYISKFLDISDNIVFHVIAGVNDISILDDLISLCDKKNKPCKVLILGYKVFGFGINYAESHKNEINKNIDKWIKNIRSYIGKCVMSFDNLGIEQLRVKKLFTIEGWKKFYMGDDFVHTMYIDAVNQEFAPTSRSDIRIKFNEISLENYFKSRLQNNEFITR